MAEPTTLDAMIERTKNLPARVLPDVVSGNQLAVTRRDIIARQFAALYLEHGMDEIKAYRAMVAAFNGRISRPPKSLQVPRQQRMVRRWLMLALPYVQKLLLDAQDRAGTTLDAAMNFIKTVLVTNPSTFAVVEGEKHTYKPFQANISDAQRAVITRMKIDPETGKVVDISTPDASRAIEQLLRLMELQSVGKGGTASDSVAKRINERFQKARLMRVDERKKPVLVAAAQATAKVVPSAQAVRR